MADPRFQPNSLLVRPPLFGHDPDALWIAATDAGEAALLAEAYWQHLAAIVVRKHLDARTMTQREAAPLLGLSPGMLSAKLTGRYPATPAELFRWAFVFDDVSILPPPADTVAGLLPPRTRGGRKHRYTAPLP